MRQKMSPGFTFNKLKYMIDQIKECIDCLKLNIDKIVKEESGEIEIRDMMSKYSTDVIGSCAFGLKLDAINDPDSEFRKYGKAVVTPSIRNQIISAILLTQPLLLRLLPKNNRRQETISFFKNAFQQTIQYREKNGIDRKDFVEQLMKAREDLVLNPESKNTDVTFSEMDIVANAYILFIAGFDTVSTTLTCALYELALNSTIQNRVREEIQCEKLKNAGQLNHEFLSNLTYMHMVIKETLRKHPPLGILERVVTEPYKIPGSNVTLENGTKIIIPIRSIQHDPKYYSNPDEFDPERFSKENESNLYPNTYYPFGDGPRLCLGKRFAELEMKIALSEILSNFEILPYEKTQIPLQYIIGSFVNAPENVWLIFKPINT
ncbi:probable cytochrome P450 6a14 isoform X2 [Daktulosphaira vitifoliae]|nr:probable cytochrome P450 6a14 isoform X2 [Daktulosphaira vitifoliae]